MPSALFVTTVTVTLEAFLAPFADHFRAQGWRVDALANGASADRNIVDSFDNRYDISWSRNPFDLGNGLSAAARVRRIVDDGDYDIVHVHTPIAAFVARYALRGRRGRPAARRPVIIYTAHGFHFYEGGSAARNSFYLAAERLASRWTDYLVTINRQDFEAAQRFVEIDANRVRLIPGIGVDTMRFAPGAVSHETACALRSEWGIAKDEFALVMVAEFGAVKRHTIALDALARVRDPRVRLVLVGSGPLESRLRERAVAFGLADRVTFVGYRRDMPAVLAASNALLLTSEREGLNRSVLEAMASGKPVIGTDTRGITDAVGETAGWIVGHNDVAGLAAAIDAATSNPAEVARRGAAARERALSEYDLPRIITAYEELYREALASRV